MNLHIALGEAACLTAALCWAISLTLFRGLIAIHGARAVNLLKCSLATLLLGTTALAFGQIGALSAAPRGELFLVAASGVVGLSLGDSALFAAVHQVGVYRTVLLQSLAPVFTALLAVSFLGERLRPAQVAGALIILGGVTLVVTQRGQSAVAAQRSFTPLGVLFGILAALGQGAGIVLAKQGMLHLSPLPASFLRLGSAALGLLVTVGMAGRLPAAAAMVSRPAALLRLARPTLLGSYLGILMMMTGIAFAPASVAAVLLATTPVFSLFIDARLTGERIRASSLAGTLLAVFGVGMLSLGGG